MRPSSTLTPTATAVVTPTATAVVTPTATAIITPTATATVTATLTPTRPSSPTTTATVTPRVGSPTPTPVRPTATMTPTVTPSLPVVTPTATTTPAITPTPEPVRPQARFIARPLQGTVPLTVTFVNSSTGATVYRWDFGDGATGSVLSPTHLYRQAGIYTVSLAAGNGTLTDTLTRTAYLTVVESPPLPVADFTAAPLVGLAPLTVTFANHSEHAVTYRWDFGDGSGSQAISPTHLYRQAGVYTVSLVAGNGTVSDSQSRTEYITVLEPRKPQAYFTAEPLQGAVPLTVTFINSSTQATAYRWQFGDGQGATVVSPTHAYSRAGVYTVSLTAGNGVTSDTLTRTGYFTVSERLTVAFSAFPRAGQSPLVVQFFDQSTDIYTGTGPVERQWHFGDGLTATVRYPTHTYTAPGLYTVSLVAGNGLVSNTLTRTGYITASLIRDWQPLTLSTTVPPITGEHGMAYDDSRQRVVLFGGNGTGWPYLSTTWELSGTVWSAVETVHRPPARYGAGLAYDSVHQRVVLFGGSDERDIALNQSWHYDGVDWSLELTATRPASRSYLSMAANPISGTIYLFGGHDRTTYYQDLWRYDNGNWSEVVVSGARPLSRTLAAMTYDTANQRLLLFGGRTVTGTLLADLWAFDPGSNSWQELADGGDGGGPPPRLAPTLTYDPDTGLAVLVGGLDAGQTVLTDTWHYRTGWQEAEPTNAPPAFYHRAVYDSTGHRIILFSTGEGWSYE